MPPARRTVVVFDAESDVSFAKCVGHSRNEKMRHMQATVICALVLDASLCLDAADADRAMATAEALHWWRDDNTHGVNPFAPLLALFDDAAAIVAYNGLGFDFPLLRKHYAADAQGQARYVAHRFKCHDPMVRLLHAVDAQPKLDALLLANGLPTKTADGLQAIHMWEANERDKLRDYCAEDVRLLALLVLRDTVRVPGVGTVSAAVVAVGPVLVARHLSNIAAHASQGEALQRVLIDAVDATADADADADADAGADADADVSNNADSETAETARVGADAP